MRKLIAFTVATIMSVSALAGPASMFRCVAKPNQIQNAVKGAFVRTQTRVGMRGVFAQYIASNGKVIAEHQLVRRTPKQMLLEYAPSKIRSSLKAEAIRSSLKTAGKITGNAIMRFPEEAAAFFFAIGAITYGQTLLDFNANPVAVEQYLGSQKDPIGQVAFMNFMIANGLASHAMMQAFKNPAFRPFIPYFGMSIGMMASNITHELAHLPHIKECIASIKAGKEDPSCDKAYSSWTDFGYEKMHEYAPTFVSMWASSLLSGMVSQCLSAAVTWTSAQVVKFVGIQVAMSLTPVGWVARGGHFILKVGQLGMFVGLDMLINPYITTPYRNVKESYELVKTEEELFLSLKEHKAYGWEKPTTHDLSKVLEDFELGMTQWRALNMQKVQMAHANWMEHLSKLTRQYQSAKDYYSHFTEEVWQKNYGRYAGSGYVNIVDRKMPLNGVMPANFNDQELSAFVEMPDEIQSKQLETVRTVVERMKAMLKSEKVRRHMTDEDVVHFNEIRAALSSNDPMKIGLGLIDLNKRASGWDGCVDSIRTKCKETSPNLRAIFGVVRKLLGNPEPLMAPGLGYAAALKLHPEFGPNQANFMFQGRDKDQFGAIVTPDNASYLTASMLYGPTANKNLIQEKHGFAAQFFPPRISNVVNFGNDAGYDWGIPGKWNSVYWVHAGNRNPNRPEQFHSLNKSLYEILTGGNIIPQILNPKANGFDTWWSTNVEAQFLQAWLKYEKQYQKIVSDLVTQLWTKDESNFNGSGLRAGMMYSLHQERQLAMMVLGEIVKDTFPNYPQILSARKNSEVREASGTGGKNGLTRIAVALADGSKPNLYAKIAINDSLEFDALMAPTLLELGSSPKIDGRNFEFQHKIWESFGKLTQVVRKIKPVTITRKGKQLQITASSVTNAEIDAAVNEVKAMIQASQTMLQVLDENSFKAKVAKQAFKILEKNADEIGMTAKIANAVSYVENFQKAEGEPVNMRCQTSSRVQANNHMQRILQADCEDFELKPSEARAAQAE